MYCGNNMVELATSTVKPWRRLAAVSYFKHYFPPPPRFWRTTGDRRKIIIFWYCYLFWKCKHLVSVISAALKGYTAEHRPKNLKEEGKERRAKLVLIGWSGMRWTYTAKKLAKNVTAEEREITALAVRSREKCKRTYEKKVKIVTGGLNISISTHCSTMWTSTLNFLYATSCVKYEPLTEIHTWRVREKLRKVMEIFKTTKEIWTQPNIQ